VRRLRVLAEHPAIGKPNDVLADFPGAQAYIDAGLAEWIPSTGGARVDPHPGDLVVETIETTSDVTPAELATRRPSGRARRTQTVTRAGGGAARVTPPPVVEP
jgi:hypothetical protein